MRPVGLLASVRKVAASEGDVLVHKRGKELKLTVSDNK
jgi:hypothetical protein